MNQSSIRAKLGTAPEACFVVLDPVKSKRMGGAKTLYIPSVEDVAKAIRAIPRGETRTIEQLRSQLATWGHAETACPANTIKYWKWMANLSDELQPENKDYQIPWWRVLKNGKASRHMPGGIDNQLSILRNEGVLLG
ncbi:MAG: MGMT family protein [Williamsia sp.]|nr:MGMT family protein [Williamsia sp.]